MKKWQKLREYIIVTKNKNKEKDSGKVNIRNN